jgi:hypothetical protein
MIRAYPALNRRQRALLTAVHQLGLTTDLALSAAAVGAGEDALDQSTIVRWRKGEGHAPLGLLPVLLDHVDDPAAVLDLLARPLGLQVVPVPSTVGLRSVQTEALEVVAAAMAIVDAHTRGSSAAQIVSMARTLAREAAELGAAAGAEAK